MNPEKTAFFSPRPPERPTARPTQSALRNALRAAAALAAALILAAAAGIPHAQAQTSIPTPAQLLQAIFDGNLNLVRQYLNQGANPNSVCGAANCSGASSTADLLINYAVFRANNANGLAVLQALLDAGANPNYIAIQRPDRPNNVASNRNSLAFFIRQARPRNALDAAADLLRRHGAHHRGDECATNTVANAAAESPRCVPCGSGQTPVDGVCAAAPAPACPEENYRGKRGICVACPEGQIVANGECRIQCENGGPADAHGVCQYDFHQSFGQIADASTAAQRRPVAAALEKLSDNHVRVSWTAPANAVGRVIEYHVWRQGSALQNFLRLDPDPQICDFRSDWGNWHRDGRTHPGGARGVIPGGINYHDGWGNQPRCTRWRICAKTAAGHCAVNDDDKKSPTDPEEWLITDPVLERAYDRVRGRDKDDASMPGDFYEGVTDEVDDLRHRVFLEGVDHCARYTKKSGDYGYVPRAFEPGRDFAVWYYEGDKTDDAPSTESHNGSTGAFPGHSGIGGGKAAHYRHPLWCKINGHGDDDGDSTVAPFCGGFHGTRILFRIRGCVDLVGTGCWSDYDVACDISDHTGTVLNAGASACETLSYYQPYQRNCACENLARPVALELVAGEGRAAVNPANCQCDVTGADGNCACPGAKVYDPDTNACVDPPDGQEDPPVPVRQMSVTPASGTPQTDFRLSLWLAASEGRPAPGGTFKIYYDAGETPIPGCSGNLRQANRGETQGLLGECQTRLPPGDALIWGEYALSGAAGVQANGRVAGEVAVQVDDRADCETVNPLVNPLGGRLGAQIVGVTSFRRCFMRRGDAFFRPPGADPYCVLGPAAGAPGFVGNTCRTEIWKTLRENSCVERGLLYKGGGSGNLVRAVDVDLSCVCPGTGEAPETCPGIPPRAPTVTVRVTETNLVEVSWEEPELYRARLQNYEIARQVGRPALAKFVSVAHAPPSTLTLVLSGQPRGSVLRYKVRTRTDWGLGTLSAESAAVEVDACGDAEMSVSQPDGGHLCECVAGAYRTGAGMTCEQGWRVSLFYSSGGTVSVSWAENNDLRSGGRIARGATLTATATPEAGRARDWGWDCSERGAADSRCVLTATMDVSIRADFPCEDFHDAARSGGLAGVNCNLASGADPDAKDDAGDAPLHLAVEGARNSVAARLLEAGADKELKDAAGLTPLLLAATLSAGSGATLVAGTLLDGGADAGATTRLGDGVLHHSIRRNAGSQALFFLGWRDAAAANASALDVNAENNAGLTPLRLAVSLSLSFDSERAAVIGRLIESGGHHGEACPGTSLPNGDALEPLCLSGFPVLFSHSAGGTLSASWRLNANLRDGDSVATGATVNFRARPDAGYSISLWSGDCAGKSGEDCAVEDVSARVSVGVLFACTDIIGAAGGGNLDAVECIVAGDENSVHRKDARGRTALHYAAQGGHLDVVKRLLTLGATLNAADNDGETPLTQAAEQGYAEVFRELALEGGHHGAACEDSEVPNPDGAEPPCVSCGTGEVVSGGVCACAEGHFRLGGPSSMCLGGARAVSVFFSSGGTVSVSWAGDADLQSGAEVSVGVSLTLTALPEVGYSFSSWAGDCASAGGRSAGGRSCALRVTAAVSVSAAFACTEIHAAAAAGSLSAVNCFADGDGDLNERDAAGRTALHHAAAGGHLAVVERLLTLRASVNVLDDDGDTPLTEAADSAHSEVFRLLAGAGGRHGAECGSSQIPNPSGKTPPCVCAEGYRSVGSGCVHPTAQLPEDQATCVDAFGGAWEATGTGFRCSGIDINDTFCLANSPSALSCRGLFSHVRDCNVKHNRPALDPFHCAGVCASGRAAGAKCE